LVFALELEPVFFKSIVTGMGDYAWSIAYALPEALRWLSTRPLMSLRSGLRYAWPLRAGITGTPGEFGKAEWRTCDSSQLDFRNLNCASVRPMKSTVPIARFR
jgi:hypothetical protein